MQRDNMLERAHSRYLSKSNISKTRNVVRYWNKVTEGLRLLRMLLSPSLSLSLFLTPPKPPGDNVQGGPPETHTQHTATTNSPMNVQGVHSHCYVQCVVTPKNEQATAGSPDDCFKCTCRHKHTQHTDILNGKHISGLNQLSNMSVQPGSGCSCARPSPVMNIAPDCSQFPRSVHPGQTRQQDKSELNLEITSR